MHPGALQALEFEQIVGAVRSLALTPLGAARLQGLRPHTEARRVAALLAATSEGTRYLADNGTFPLRAPPDLDAILSALAIEGRPLEPLRVLGLADFLDSVEQTRTAVRRAAGQFPLLHAMTEGSSSFKGEIADVRDKIDAGGQVLDHASADLRSIRDRLKKHRARLRGTLESFLRGKDTAKYLQDQIVTDRNGRYVLVVKAEHRAAIPGIIHGSSTSGASLFLEPLSTVEVNNEVVALEEQEAAEVRRILLALSDAFRRRAAELQRLVELATELDTIQAKARFSKLIGGVEPALSPDGAFELRAARHPLLIEAMVARLGAGPADTRAAEGGLEAEDTGDAPERERPAAGPEAAGQRPKAYVTEPVPVDIVLIPPTSVLVISGPNTGGKTVALKTAGLLVLMAQSGLHVPAAPGSRLPIFRSVFADIGDEQSIAASLSTFSWHITNIVSMDRSLALPGLVLFDEIGAGTDPAEGGALATAVIDHFRRKGALVIATTHSDTVKTYASTTEGVGTAAFGFDPETFAPTYRLVYGSPGRSLALEIAGRLGVTPSILDAARQNLSVREAQLAEHLAKIEQDLHALEHDRRLVAREHQMLTDAEARMRSREEALRQREDAAKRRLDEQLEERLRAARREIDRVVDDLKRRTDELAAQAERRALKHVPAISTGEAGTARSEARSALETAIEQIRHAGGEPADQPAPQAGQARPVIGDRVAVPGLGLEGTLAAIHDHEGEIDVKGKRVRARLGDLRVVTHPASAPSARVSVNVVVQSREGAPSDLNVIGCSTEDALARVERFLDDSLLTELRTVRVIHGYGTGQLKRAIAQFLQSHPLVARFDSAPPEQGGGGVTVVELKE